MEALNIDMAGLNETNVIINNSLANQVDEFKEKIIKETIDNVLKTIEINDSFFYAKMVVYKNALFDDPYGDKVTAKVELRLFNSTEFDGDYRVSDARTLCQPKIIKTEVTLDKSRLDNKVDATKVLYNLVADAIAQELFFRNIEDIDMIVTDRQKSYI